MSKISRPQAIALALFVAFIWSLSWVFIKIGLQDEIPPLTFAGLRYTIASVILLIFTLQSKTRRIEVFSLSKRNLIELTVLGLFYYTATQGLIFLSLDQLPSATLSLLLNFTTIAILIGGISFLKEYPTKLQYFGLVIFILGVVIYFFPAELPPLLGLVFGIGTMLANAISSLLGRAINRRNTVSATSVTVVSMSIGSFILLMIGLLYEGWQPISLQGWAIILWLASVHTALTFTLWNISLQVLSATESSIINNTMLVQIAILAWVFLGETLTIRQIIALLIASIGILIFQLRKTQIKKPKN